MNAKALFSLYLYFFITFFITFFRTSHSQTRGNALAETFFPPFFHRKACQTLRGIIKTRKTGEKMSVPLLWFTDVIG